MDANAMLDEQLTQTAQIDGDICGVEPPVGALLPLLAARHVAPRREFMAATVIGMLVAISDDGHTPLVTYPGQPGTAALRARTVVDLHGPYIGEAVVLMFEEGDAARPLVMGVLHETIGWPLAESAGLVDVDADGKRMVVSAKEHLVLRCGKASITLTRAGKVLIEGSYVLSRSTGMNRIRGGAVQLN